MCTALFACCYSRLNKNVLENCLRLKDDLGDFLEAAGDWRLVLAVVERLLQASRDLALVHKEQVGHVVVVLVVVDILVCARLLFQLVGGAKRLAQLLKAEFVDAERQIDGRAQLLAIVARQLTQNAASGHRWLVVERVRVKS